MIKHCLLASTVLAGVIALSLPASSITIGGATAKFQTAVSDSASDSPLFIQTKGKRDGKGGTARGKGGKNKGKGGGGIDDDDDDDDDDQGDDDDDQDDDDDDNDDSDDDGDDDDQDDDD